MKKDTIVFGIMGLLIISTIVLLLSDVNKEVCTTSYETKIYSHLITQPSGDYEESSLPNCYTSKLVNGSWKITCEDIVETKICGDKIYKTIYTETVI